MSIVPIFSIAPILDDDSTSESSEDSAQAAARAEVQKQRKLKPGTLTLQANGTTVHNWFSNWLYACMEYLTVTFNITLLPIPKKLHFQTLPIPTIWNDVQKVGLYIMLFPIWCIPSGVWVLN